MTLGSPLVSPRFAGCHVPTDRRQRTGESGAAARGPQFEVGIRTGFVSSNGIVAMISDLRRDRQIVGQMNVHRVRAVRGGNLLQRIEHAHIFRYSQPVVWPAFFSNEKMSIRLIVGDRVNVDIAAHP